MRQTSADMLFLNHDFLIGFICSHWKFSSSQNAKPAMSFYNKKKTVSQKFFSGELAPDNIFDDRSGLIYIAASHREPGTILTTNAIASQIFGFSRYEMDGKNVSMVRVVFFLRAAIEFVFLFFRPMFQLMPQPYSTHHSLFLRRYLESAQSKYINIFKDVFGLHRNGFIFPVSLTV